MDPFIVQFIFFSCSAGFVPVDIICTKLKGPSDLKLRALSLKDESRALLMKDAMELQYTKCIQCL